MSEHFRIPLIAALLWLAVPTAGASQDGLEVARQKVGDGDHAAAVPYLEAHVAASPPSAQTRYELGVAKLAAGDPAGAALALRRALLLDPGFAPARAALGEANAELGIAGQREGWLERTVGRLPAQGLVIAALALVWGGVFLILGGATVRRGRLVTVVAGCLLSLAGAGVALLVYLGDPLERARDTVYVSAAGGCGLMRSPMESADRVVALRQGSVVEVLSRSGRWGYGEAANGARGWFPLDAGEPLVPAPAALSGAAGE